MKFGTQRIDGDIPGRDVEIAEVRPQRRIESGYDRSESFLDRLAEADEEPFYIETKVQDGSVEKYIVTKSETGMNAVRRALASKTEDIELVRKDEDPLQRTLNDGDYIAAGEGCLRKSRAYPPASVDDKEDGSRDIDNASRSISREIGGAEVYLQSRFGTTPVDVAKKRPRRRAYSHVAGAVSFFVDEVIFGPQDEENLEKETRKERLLRRARKSYNEDVEEEMKRRSGREKSYRVGIRAVATGQRPEDASYAMEAVREEIGSKTSHPIVNQSVSVYPPTTAIGSPDALGCAERMAKRKWRSKPKRMLTLSEPTFVIPRSSELALIAHILPGEREGQDREGPEFNHPD
jgi:hypothetical protein